MQLRITSLSKRVLRKLAKFPHENSVRNVPVFVVDHKLKFPLVFVITKSKKWKLKGFPSGFSGFLLKVAVVQSIWQRLWEISRENLWNFDWILHKFFPKSQPNYLEFGRKDWICYPRMYNFGRKRIACFEWEMMKTMKREMTFFPSVQFKLLGFLCEDLLRIRNNGVQLNENWTMTGVE